MELDFAGRHAGQRLLGDALPVRARLAHSHEPLVGQHRLNHHAGAVATRHFQFVLVGLDEQARRFQIGHNLLARIESIHTAILRRGVVVDFAIQRQHGNQRQAMALAHGVVVEVMRGGHFHHTGTEFPIHVFVGNDRNGTVAQRQLHLLANQMRIALVVGMHHHRHVAQQGFRPRGGHHQMPGTIRQWIADVVHETVFFFLHHFQIRHGSVQLGIPVHQPLAAINQAFLVQADKGFRHRTRQPFVHGETLTRPIRRGA